MATESDRLQVGYVQRAHGLKGDVVVRLTTNRTERLGAGAELFTAADGGETLVVARSRPKEKDHLVVFEGIRFRDQAEALRGIELWAVPLDDPDELWIHDLVGRAVVDADGVTRGMVEHVEANPASDLLVLDTGALVPARFVTHVEDDRIEVEVPAGLFEIND